MAGNMALERELKEKQVVLAVIPDEQYQSELVRILKSVEKNSRSILHVSFKPHLTLLDIFKRGGVSPAKFSIMEFSLPCTLTELSFRISSNCKGKKFDVMVLDSLQSLVAHANNKNEVLRFVHALTVRARMLGCSAVFPIPYGGMGPSVIDDLAMFVDSVFDLEALRKTAVLKEVFHLSEEKSKIKR